MFDQNGELEFILNFAKEQDFGCNANMVQIRSLWIAYCLHHDYECDTSAYDADLKKVWDVLDGNCSCPWNSDDLDTGFELFDRYMCEGIT